MKKVYAAYRGDEYIGTGDKFELAELLNVQPETIRWYTTPSYQKRIEERPESNRRITLVPITEDDEYEM